MSNNPEPGFRVTSNELSNEEAWDAMQDAIGSTIESVLESRLKLLNLGFSVEHSLCKEFDKTAREYEIKFQVVRRDRGAIVETVVDM